MYRFSLIGACLTWSVALGDELHVPAEFPTIQLALDAASNGDEVIVAPGIYNEALDMLGKHITLRSSGGAQVTTLDGVGLDTSILTLDQAEVGIIEGFTFMRGEGTVDVRCTGAGPQPGRFGGGIFLLESMLMVRDCVFTDNFNAPGSSVLAGGGINVENGVLTVERCSFENNASTVRFATVYGPGISACDRLDGPGSTVIVRDSTFERNGYRDPSGSPLGTIFSWGPNLIVERCDFAFNRGSFGAGVMALSGLPNEPYGPRSVLISSCSFDSLTASGGGGVHLTVNNESYGRIKDCTFTNNVCTKGGGAFISSTIGTFDRPPGRVEIVGCTFAANAALGAGGSVTGGGLLVAVNEDGSILIDSCVFEDNLAEWAGGGLFAELRSGGHIDVSNCLMTGNSAGRFGGGLSAGVCSNNTRQVSITNSTILDNVAGDGGGGIATWVGCSPSGLVDVRSSIVRSNVPNQLEEFLTPLVASSNNVMGGFPGQGNIDDDPAFIDPGIGDFRIGPRSPCIDAGDNFLVPAGVTMDLAGMPRFVDDPGTTDTGIGVAPIVDMGAFEFQVPDCPADIDGDGDADADDFFAFLDAFASGNFAVCDIDTDGDCDAEDFFLYLDWFVQPC